MQSSHFERVKAAIANSASADRIIELEEVIRTAPAEKTSAIALARRTKATSEKPKCPHSLGDDVVLHGKDKNDRPCFRCRNTECRRTYNILTDTPVARARKPQKWGRYHGYMTDHMSIRKIVRAGIGVNHVTVWRWRHRFLKAAANVNAATLSGVIEADGIFFLRSFKGSRDWMRGRAPEARAAGKSAWGSIKRGASSEQVPVLTALDNAGGVYERVLGTTAEIETATAGRITCWISALF